MRQTAYASSAVLITTETAASQRTATEQLHAWLISYVTRTHEKAARAYVRQGEGTLEEFTEAIATRTTTGLVATNADQTDWDALF